MAVGNTSGLDNRLTLCGSRPYARRSSLPPDKLTHTLQSIGWAFLAYEIAGHTLVALSLGSLCQVPEERFKKARSRLIWSTQTAAIGSAIVVFLHS